MTTFEPRPFPKDRKKIKCAVSGCKSNSHDNLELCFHVFPEPNKRFVYLLDRTGKKRKVDQLIAWTTILNIECEVTSYMRICSLHFKREDYVPKGDSERRFKLLYRNAIPSSNLPCSNANLIERIEEREKKLAKEWNEVKPSSALWRTEESDCLDSAQNHESSPSKGNHQPINFVECGQLKLEKNSVNDQCELNSFDDGGTRVEYKLVPNNFFVRGSENLVTQIIEGALMPPDSLASPLRQDFGAQVNMHECKFSELLTNDRQLGVFTGLKNFKVLRRIVEKVKMVTNNKYEKSTIFLNTEDRVLMTFVKLKHELSCSFIAVMFQCVSREECAEIFLETARIVYKYLDELDIPWPTLNLEKILRNTLGLALNADSYVSDDETMEDEKVES